MFGSQEALNEAFAQFKDVADAKSVVTDADIEAIMSDADVRPPAAAA